MKNRFSLAVVVLALFLGACTTPPRQTIALAPDSVSSKSGRVGVAMTSLPQADTHLPGANCLLCLAVASAANSSLTKHVRTLSQDDLRQLKNELVALLAKKGVDATAIAEDIDLKALPAAGGKEGNLADKDFSSLQHKYKVDKLLLIDITTVGMRRTYASYVPTSDPKAVLEGMGYLVNLKTNTYEWYQPVMAIKSSDGPWDEPPKYPGLTNAYFQAMEIGRDNFLQPFAH